MIYKLTADRMFKPAAVRAEPQANRKIFFLLADTTGNSQVEGIMLISCCKDRTRNDIPAFVCMKRFPRFRTSRRMFYYFIVSHLRKKKLGQRCHEVGGSALTVCVLKATRASSILVKGSANLLSFHTTQNRIEQNRKILLPFLFPESL